MRFKVRARVGLLLTARKGDGTAYFYEGWSYFFKEFN